MTKLQAHRQDNTSTWTALNLGNSNGEIGDRIRDCLACLDPHPLSPRLDVLSRRRPLGLKVFQFFTSLSFSLSVYLI